MPHDAFRRSWQAIVRGARAIAGVPDYQAYLEHCRARHPERPLPSRTTFFRERLQARYGRGGNGRCC